LNLNDAHLKPTQPLARLMATMRSTRSTRTEGKDLASKTSQMAKLKSVTYRVIPYSKLS